MAEESNIHLTAGLAAFQDADYDTAVKELEVATRLDEGNFRAFLYLGAAYGEREKYDEAIGAFKRAGQLRPNVPSLHYNLGQAYEAAGVPSEAVYEYNRALEIEANYIKAQEALEDLKKRLGQA